MVTSCASASDCSLERTASEPATLSDLLPMRLETIQLHEILEAMTSHVGGIRGKATRPTGFRRQKGVDWSRCSGVSVRRYHPAQGKYRSMRYEPGR